MSKLVRKFLLRISAVLIAVTALSLFLNNSFMERFYLREKKIEINQISQKLLDQPERVDQLIEELEQEYQVVIVKIPGSEDNDKVNEELRAAFLNKGLGLNKYWLWDQDYAKTISKGRQLRIYNQGKLNYSILIEYLSLNEEFVGVAMIIPNVREMIHMINLITAGIFGMAVAAVIIILYFLVRRITDPLNEIGILAKDISKQKFRQIEVHTNDEIEVLAGSINEMGSRIEEVQGALLEKNRQMEALLGNVSHDLKTPLTLVKAYASGMRDGIDDGTFLDTIIAQNERMEKMVEGLLQLSRMQQKDTLPELVNISRELEQILEDQMISIQDYGISLSCTVQPDITISTCREAVNSLFMNLVSNAVKYTADKKIELELTGTPGGFSFTITNGIQQGAYIDSERLWEPFYVGEISRNKELSGTGLGLSIVRAVAQKQGFEYGCKMGEKEIVFYVYRTEKENEVEL